MSTMPDIATARATTIKFYATANDGHHAAVNATDGKQILKEWITLNSLYS